MAMDDCSTSGGADGFIDRVQALRRELVTLADANASCISSGDSAIGEGLLQCILPLSCIVDQLQPISTVTTSAPTTAALAAPEVGLSCTPAVFREGEGHEASSSSSLRRAALHGFDRVRQLFEDQLLKSPCECAPQVRVFALAPTEESSSPVRVEFLYGNTPIRGWTKCVTLRSGGKTKGKLDVRYISPDKIRKIRTKADLVASALKFNLAQVALDYFDFRQVYCICQTPHSSHRTYIECSYGLCGCNSWVHPECVGLGSRTMEDVKRLGKVVCPLCFAYLGSDRDNPSHADALRGKIALSSIVLGQGSIDSSFLGFHVEECGRAHSLWGLEGSACSYHALPAADCIPSGLDRNSNRSSLIVQLPPLPDDVEQPLEKRRRTCLREDGKVVRVGVCGGFLVAPVQPKSFTDLPHHSASQLEQQHKLMMLSQLALRGYRHNPRSRYRRTMAKSVDAGSYEYTSTVVVLPLQDGGLRTCVANLAGKATAFELNKICSERLLCRLCFGGVSPVHARDTSLLHSACSSVLQTINPAELLAQDGASCVISPSITVRGWCRAYSTEGLDSDGEDTVCSLCGHSGGCLIEFELSIGDEDSDRRRFTSHFTCLHVFYGAVSSGSCKIHPSNSDSIVFYGLLAGVVGGSDRGSNSELNYRRKCSYCGNGEGLVWRCAAMHCSAVIHPLCSSLTGEADWCVQCNSSDGSSLIAALCPFHRKL